MDIQWRGRISDCGKDPLLHGRPQGAHGGRMPFSIPKHQEVLWGWGVVWECGVHLNELWQQSDQSTWWVRSRGKSYITGIDELGLGFEGERFPRKVGWRSWNRGQSTCRKWITLVKLKPRWVFSQRELVVVRRLLLEHLVWRSRSGIRHLCALSLIFSNFHPHNQYPFILNQVHMPSGRVVLLNFTFSG